MLLPEKRGTCNLVIHRPCPPVPGAPLGAGAGLRGLGRRGRGGRAVVGSQEARAAPLPPAAHPHPLQLLQAALGCFQLPGLTVPFQFKAGDKLFPSLCSVHSWLVLVLQMSAWRHLLGEALPDHPTGVLFPRASPLGHLPPSPHHLLTPLCPCLGSGRDSWSFLLCKVSLTPCPVADT